MSKKRKSKQVYKYIPPKIEYIYNSKFKLEIKSSSIKNAGLGVFANQFIPRNTLLGEYTGTLKTSDQFSCGLYALELKSGILIDAFEYPRSVFAMINDSRFSDYDYNCKFLVMENKAEIWTVNDINIDDELFINYGDDYWKYR